MAPWAGVGVGQLIVAVVLSCGSSLLLPAPSHQMGPLSLRTGSLEEGGKLTNLSGSLSWAEVVLMEDQEAKGKCLGADLHMGKMPAQLFDILVEGGGGLRGLPH